MNHGKHEAQTSKWKRKVLGLPAVGWLVAGVATTALAVVGFFVLLGSNGEVNPAQAIDVRFSTNATPTGTPIAGSLTECSISNTETTVRPVVDNAMPGAACEFTVWVVAVGPTARLEGFRVESEDFASGDIRATVAECGQMIDGETQVTFSIWVDDLAPGTGLSFDPAQDGLLFTTDALYDGSECVQT